MNIIGSDINKVKEDKRLEVTWTLKNRKVLQRVEPGRDNRYWEIEQLSKARLGRIYNPRAPRWTALLRNIVVL